jgi:hypothetical protein
MDFGPLIEARGRPAAVTAPAPAGARTPRRPSSATVNGEHGYASAASPPDRGSVTPSKFEMIAPYPLEPDKREVGLAEKGCKNWPIPAD